MSNWEILEQMAKKMRDDASKAVAETQALIDDQSVLRDRTISILDQYQSRIITTRKRAGYFRDFQLYQNAIKQLQQGVIQIESKIRVLEFEIKKRRKKLSQAESERQKYVKLIERDKNVEKRRMQRIESAELDDIGRQIYCRKRHLA